MNGCKVPFCGIDRQYRNIENEIIASTARVLSSGNLLDGNYANRFAEKMAKRCNRKYAIPVNSCTAGLHLVLTSSLTTDDIISEIAIPKFSFRATSNVVFGRSNIKINFIDVDPNSGLISLDELGSTNIYYDVIMYVNLYGNIIDYDRMRLITKFFNGNKKARFIIEDAAQSFGSSYKGIPSGKLGDISVLSFDPTKNLPNYGTGGMILTDDITTFHDITQKTNNNNGFNHSVFLSATNSKMSEVDCANMIIKLDHFDAWQKRRTEIAEYYTVNLNPNLVITPHQFITKGVIPNWHKYVIQIHHRNKLKETLTNAGIETKIHYGYPLSGFKDRQDTNASALCGKVLSLPIYPELTDNEVEYIVTVLNKEISKLTYYPDSGIQLLK